MMDIRSAARSLLNNLRADEAKGGLLSEDTLRAANLLQREVTRPPSDEVSDLQTRIRNLEDEINARAKQIAGLMRRKHEDGHAND